MKVILVLEGGLIHQAIADQDSLQIIVHDYDIEGYHEDDLSIDGDGNEVNKYDVHITTNPGFILREGYET